LAAVDNEFVEFFCTFVMGRIFNDGIALSKFNVGEKSGKWNQGNA
jgi:hypothetical protein